MFLPLLRVSGIYIRYVYINSRLQDRKLLLPSLLLQETPPLNPRCHMSGYYWASFLVQNLGGEFKKPTSSTTSCSMLQIKLPLLIPYWLSSRWKKGVQAVHV